MAKTHGKSNTRLYNTWSGMKVRCYKEKDRYYKNYGGRGIKICDEWLNDFMNFYNWSMDNGYQDNLTIDRINPNGNYEPSNCKWSTQIEQGNNRTNNHVIKFNGESHTISEWSRILGITREVLKRRLELNYPLEKVFENTSYANTLYFTFNGETHTLTEWSEISGINRSTLYGRIQKGWSIEKALTYNVKSHKEVHYEYKGYSCTLTEWSRITGIGRFKLRYGISKGYSMEELLNKFYE